MPKSAMRTVYNILEILPVPENGCRAIKVHAIKLGHTEVQAVFKQGKTKLTASITIAAYKPLKVFPNESGDNR